MEFRKGHAVIDESFTKWVGCNVSDLANTQRDEEEPNEVDFKIFESLLSNCSQKLESIFLSGIILTSVPETSTPLVFPKIETLVVSGPVESFASHSYPVLKALHLTTKFSVDLKEVHHMNSLRIMKEASESLTEVSIEEKDKDGTVEEHQESIEDLHPFETFELPKLTSLDLEFRRRSSEKFYRNLVCPLISKPSASTS